MADPRRLEDRFDRLAAALADRPEVTLPGETGGRGFGSDALRVSGSIFAMLSRDRLVVKLPRARVAELISSGAGEPFDAGKGRPMKEWVALTDADDATWLAVAEEALAFVSGASRAR